MGLNFDLRHIPRRYYKYLPLLPKYLDSVGLKVGSTITGYADLQARIQAEVSGFSVRYDYNPVSQRMDLRIQASTISPTEFRKALVLIRQMTNANYLDISNVARLRDLAKKQQAEDEAFDKNENDFWFMNPSYALRYQGDPLYLAIGSAFTRSYLEGRLKWLLHDPVGPVAISSLKDFSDEFVKTASHFSSREVQDKLNRAEVHGLERELVEYWQANSYAFPDAELLGGLRRLASEVEEDLKTGPERTIGALRELQNLIFCRKALHIDLTLSPNQLVELRPDIVTFVRSIPENRECEPRSMQSDASPVMNKVYARYHTQAPPYPWYVALVDRRNETANMAFYADFPGYSQLDRGSLLQTLSSNLVSGSGPHSVYMKTEERGLAYSGSISSDLKFRVLRFHAERSADIPSVLDLVNSVVMAVPKLQDPALIDNALQQVFPIPRSMSTFTDRGRGIAIDLRDGNDPDHVRQFSEAILKLRTEPDLLSQLTRTSKASLCPVLMTFECDHERQTARSIFFFTGSDKILTDAEQRLGLSMLRIYPADFWQHFSE
jgi:hypothetical protein